MDDTAHDAPTADDNPPPPRAGIIATIAALTVASVLFRLLTYHGYNHTALLFIGIPAVLATILALTPTPRSATGAIVRVITLALLIAWIAFGEAFVCILFAAPLIYLVGICVGALTDWSRYRKGRRGATRILGAVLLVALPAASLEGVAPGFEFDRATTVTAARVVNATPDRVRDALARPPRFGRDLPRFFKLGFPTPGAASGGGLAAGDRRTIEFRHHEHPGALTLEVRRSEPGHVAFAVARDDSYITHWLSWQQSDVRWVAVAPGRTLVTWTLTYRRRLDPAWYFAPLERYGAEIAAGYLIDALATPAADVSIDDRSAGDVFCRWLPWRH